MVPAEVLTHVLAWHILTLFLRPSDQTWPGLGKGYKTSMVLLSCVCYPSAITLLNTSDPHCVAGGDTVAAPIVLPSWEEKGEHRFWSPFCGVCRISPLPRAAPAAPSLAPRGSLCPDAGGTFLCHPGARQPGAQPRGSHNAQCPPAPPSSQLGSARSVARTAPQPQLPAGSPLCLPAPMAGRGTKGSDGASAGLHCAPSAPPAQSSAHPRTCARGGAHPDGRPRPRTCGRAPYMGQHPAPARSVLPLSAWERSVLAVPAPVSFSTAFFLLFAQRWGCRA